jgi:hypothetical protein
MRIARLICSLSIAVGLMAIPVPSRAQVAVGISVRVGPPVLPVYVQPICPGPGYIWVPGYWAYGPDGYFWVPGTWVFPPEEGLLWTPGYWGWDDGFYIWHEGYWGPVVGFYGGINYGFGYPGVGFYGGYWQGGTFFYNRSVTNVNVTVVRNTYNTTVVNNNTTVNRVSFNGGAGGTAARPTAVELAAARQPHVSMTSVQIEHQQAARGDRALLSSVNHGRPDVAASPRPGEFHGHGPLIKESPVNPNRGPKNRGEMNRPGTNAPDISSRPMNREDRPGRQPENNRRTFEDRPPSSRPSNAAPVNPKLEQKQQRELERMRKQQEADHQRMQRQHDQEQRQLQQRNANQQRQGQLQRRQEQQTQQMERKHDQQTQKLQDRQQREQQKQEKRPPQDRKPSGLH